MMEGRGKFFLEQRVMTPAGGTPAVPGWGALAGAFPEHIYRCAGLIVVPLQGLGNFLGRWSWASPQAVMFRAYSPVMEMTEVPGVKPRMDADSRRCLRTGGPKSHAKAAKGATGIRWIEV